MHISYLYASKASNRGLEGCDPTIHTYELNDKHDKPWLILNVKSLNHSPSELPIIFGELPVTGSVALDLKEETQVKSISISVSYILISLSILLTLYFSACGEDDDPGHHHLQLCSCLT